MLYVDVILPLPLDGTFTYSVPDTLAPKVKPGMRLVVPLGKSKTYTAIALTLPYAKTDEQTRANGKAITFKPIITVPDTKPVLLPHQLKLWLWMADYYLSPLGDIFKAALPSGLKEEDGYRPRTETYVTLGQQYRSEQALQVAFAMLKRSTKATALLKSYLTLSHWQSLQGTTPRDPITEITREELTNESGATLFAIQSLMKRNILTTYQKEVGRLNDGNGKSTEPSTRLSEAQQDAYNNILMQFLSKDVVLLHGVTSSGKTEIYIHLIEKALTEHKQVLYLLPEIALTVQITERLKRVFGNRLGIYHSRYSDAERVEIWQKQLSGHPYDVILGARSAVFLPFQNLGLVIIDEEHETSFKQQEPSPRYHARSVAIMMARQFGAKTLLGTATPCMESFYNAQKGKYGYVKLTQRYKGLELPLIEVADIKDLYRRKMMQGPFSPVLLGAVKKALANGEQAILFQNRRGFAPMVECHDCGWVPKCPNCDVSLTLHKNMNQLVCHYCGFVYRVPDRCPNCGCEDMRSRGFGTEKIEDEVQRLLPEARIARMDLDTTRTKNAYERIIHNFASGKTNLLIGTQMVSKGLDFGKVSVVGILNADSMLNYPDFRAYEHAYMMMAQVSGRAGRRGHRGMVVLQTKHPELPVIREVVNNDYETFYQALLTERRDFHYPPFCHLIYVFLKHRNEHIVETASTEMGTRLRAYFANRVLGPDKPAVARVKTLSIRKIVLKLEIGIDMKRVRQCLRMVQQDMLRDRLYGALQIYYDVDPL